MTPAERSDHMRQLIRASGLTRAETAAALSVSVGTVHAWLRPIDNAAHRNPPAMAIKMMEGIVEKGRRS